MKKSTTYFSPGARSETARPRRPGAPKRPPPVAPTDETLAGLPARVAAMALVEAALARRGGFDEALTLAPFSHLTGPDRGFARMLASATLRGLGKIDAILAARLKSPPPEKVQALLRIGAAQILYGLAPAFAAVSSTLALAEHPASLARYKGLINAVLRGMDRDGGPALAAALAPSANAPPWLFSRWSAAYGEAVALQIAARIEETPPTDLTLKSAEDADQVAAALDAVVLPTGSLRTERRGDVAEWPLFTEGAWWVQDVAAALPARLLAIRPGETVLDMCAAPGGKTLQLAAAGARVTALDRSPARLTRVEANLARTGLIAELASGDAAQFGSDRLFDAVLLDAPCSATGTFRRQPDVLWGARPGDIAKLAGVQSRLLDAAARLTRPNGRLVYCVCSLEPEEGEAQVTAFLHRHPEFARDRIDLAELGIDPTAQTRDGDLRLLPSAALSDTVSGQDGFFAAIFRKMDGAASNLPSM